MRLLVLGSRGKMGKLVTEIATQRGHDVRGFDVEENADATGLTPANLDGIDAAIDFTTPKAVLPNLEACLRAGTNMVIGTTGWYGELPHVRDMVNGSKSGVVFGANFSIGVNLFFEIIRVASEALTKGYNGQIMERHHVHKLDAPSGTAVAMQRIIEEKSGQKLEITSVREGETVGMHTLMLDSPNDSMLLVHDAKSRGGFADGAVRAAEWIAGKKGFHDFKDIYREL